MFPSALPTTFQSLNHIHTDSSLFFRHRAGPWVLGSTTDVCFLHLLAVCITQLLSTAGFCSVLSFYKIVPEFPITISELKNPSPLTQYFYSTNRIKKLSLLVFVFTDWKITQHFPTSFTYSLFVSSLLSILPKTSVFPSLLFPVFIDMRKPPTPLQKFSRNPDTKLNYFAPFLLS